jgi:hypothetical protein
MRISIETDSRRLEAAPTGLITLGPRLGIAAARRAEGGVRSVIGRGHRTVEEPGTTPEADPVAHRFAALLDESADVYDRRPGHPAYLRMIDELAADEARILRLFVTAGAQPAVDVRTKRPFGVGDRLVAPGITMIGLQAGCADPDRVPAYLNNLHRLGLIWFSGEPIAEVDGYQVLEAQPDVSAGRIRGPQRPL